MEGKPTNFNKKRFENHLPEDLVALEGMLTSIVSEITRLELDGDTSLNKGAQSKLQYLIGKRDELIEEIARLK